MARPLTSQRRDGNRGPVDGKQPSLGLRRLFRRINQAVLVNHETEKIMRSNVFITSEERGIKTKSTQKLNCIYDDER